VDSTFDEQIYNCLFLNINLTNCVRKRVRVIYRASGLNISSIVTAPLLIQVDDHIYQQIKYQYSKVHLVD